MADDMRKKIGVYAFIAGIVISIIVSLIAVFGGSGASWTMYVPFVLAVLGIIVGFINVSGSETFNYLLASAAFLVSMASLSTVTGNLPASLGNGLSVFFSTMVAFNGPSTAIQAVMALIKMAKD